MNNHGDKISRGKTKKKKVNSLCSKCHAEIMVRTEEKEKDITKKAQRSKRNRTFFKRSASETLRCENHHQTNTVVMKNLKSTS